MTKKVFLAIACLAVSMASLAQSPLRSKGYKGFLNVDLSMVSLYHNDVDGSSYNNGFGLSLDITTSHGMQVCPYFFVGAGIGLRGGFGDEEAVLDMDLIQVPLFLQARANLTRKSISPYIDFKGGYGAGDMNGAFLSPALGISVPLTQRLALNVELAYRAQCGKEKFERGNETDWRHLLNFGIGIEF